MVMQSSNRSPRIKHVSWGRLEVEGEAEPYKDAKLFPGGSREWNWRETKTSHKPGIQIADVEELLEHGAKVVVLSRGMAECLHVPRETLDFLKERQIPVHVLPTQHAVALYNKLAQTEPVGRLSHTTRWRLQKRVGRVGQSSARRLRQARLARECAPTFLRL